MSKGPITSPLLGDPVFSVGDQGSSGLCPLPSTVVDEREEKSILPQ